MLILNPATLYLVPKSSRPYCKDFYQAFNLRQCESTSVSGFIQIFRFPVLSFRLIMHHGGTQGNHSSPAPIVSVNAKFVSSQFDDPDAIKTHHRNHSTAIRSNSTAEHPNQPSISVPSRSFSNNIKKPPLHWDQATTVPHLHTRWNFDIPSARRAQKGFKDTNKDPCTKLSLESLLYVPQQYQHPVWQGQISDGSSSSISGFRRVATFHHYQSSRLYNPPFCRKNHSGFLEYFRIAISRPIAFREIFFASSRPQCLQ